MRRPTNLLVTAFTLSFAVTIWATPVTSNVPAQLFSEYNSSIQAVPPEFKVDIVPDQNVPLLPEAIYRTAVNVMYDITNHPLTYPWLARDWVNTAGNLGFHVEHKDFGGKDPSRLLNQYVIWGLNHLMLSIHLSKKYCQTIAILKWKDVAIGVVFVAQRASRAVAGNPQNYTDALQVASTQVHRLEDTNEDIEVSVRFQGDKPIDRRVIFLTGMKAMGEAAELGLRRPIVYCYTQGLQQVHWKLGGGTRAFTGTMRPAYSRVAVIKTLAGMIEDGRFQNIEVWVKVDGKNTAIGGFHQGNLPSAS